MTIFPITYYLFTQIGINGTTTTQTMTAFPCFAISKSRILRSKAMSTSDARGPWAALMRLSRYKKKANTERLYMLGETTNKLSSICSLVSLFQQPLE